MADPEVVWFNEHPEPQSFEVGDELTLWNFPVAKADLAPAHEDAIKRFASAAFIANSTDHQPTDFDIRGHASVTGAEGSNRDLGQRRGDAAKAVLNAMGFRSVEVTSAGSSEPADPGTSGPALARNRRVQVKRTPLVYRVVPPEEKKPPAREPKDPAKFAPQVKVQIDLPLRKWDTTRVIIAASIVGELSLYCKGKETDPSQAGVTTTSEGTPQLSEEFAQILGRDVIAPKLGLDAGTDATPPKITIGIEAEQWFLLPKVRYQEGPYLISFNYKAIVAQLPIVDFQSAQVHMEFSGNFRFQIGPSASAVAASPSIFDPGPTVTGAPAGFMDVGPLLLAATIAAAGKTASPLAQEEITEVVLNLATRDGAAARIAAIVLGKDADVGFAERRKEWREQVSPQAQVAWSEGANQVDTLLQPLDKAAQDEKKAAWKKKYGGGPQPDFDQTRELIFRDLKGYDEDQGDLKRLIEGL